MSHYPHLFSPLTINGMTIKLYYAAYGTNMYTLNGEVSQEQLEYYELRAKGGTGLALLWKISASIFLRLQWKHLKAHR